MKIVIDLSDERPVFTQIINQIKDAVQGGHLAPGTALPSIRQLANDLQLNHNTVAKAYKLLERDAVIETRGYRGTFVHSNAVANSRVDLNEWVGSKLKLVIEEIRRSGATDSEIRIAFKNALKS